MIETLLLLFLEFFKIGLLSFGGGYAAIPFLFEIAARYDWYSVAEMFQFLAIAEVTPGPLGINMATFAGFSAAGIVGGLLATVAIVLPAFLLVLLIYRFTPGFKDAAITKNLLYGLLPVTMALIAVTGLRLAQNAYASLTGTLPYAMAALLLAGLLLLAFRRKTKPLVLLVIGAVWGALFL